MLSLAALLVNEGIRKVSFTGGEPLLREDFLEIAETLSRGGVSIEQIATNGSLIDRPLLAALKDRGQRPRISISYDGDGGAHDALRGVPGAAEAALRAFSLCREEGLETASEMTLHAGNAPVLRESIRTLKEHGCASVKVLPLFPVGAALSAGEAEILSPSGLFQVFLDYIAAYYADGLPVEIFLYGFFYHKRGMAGWLSPMDRVARGKSGPDRSLCGDAMTNPYLSPDGRLLPCAGLAGFPESVSAFPRLLDVGLNGALCAGAFLRFSRHTVRIQTEKNTACAACPEADHCGSCRIVPLSCGEGFYGRDIYSCEFFRGNWKSLIPDAIRRGRLEGMLVS
jgi:MoaA/NifB/PqqE/SkfB family radical SAM enzyme